MGKRTHNVAPSSSIKVPRPTHAPHRPSRLIYPLHYKQMHVYVNTSRLRQIETKIAAVKLKQRINVDLQEHITMAPDLNC